MNWDLTPVEILCSLVCALGAALVVVTRQLSSENRRLRVEFKATVADLVDLFAADKLRATNATRGLHRVKDQRDKALASLRDAVDEAEERGSPCGWLAPAKRVLEEADH